MLSGGCLKDIPKPHVRQWPNDDGVKRDVAFHVATYLSIGCHYHVSFNQDANPIWNPQTNEEAKPTWEAIQGTGYGRRVIGWQHAWDDEEGKGRVGGEVFSTKWKAARYIRLVVALVFPGHRITVNAMDLDEWLVEQEHEESEFYYKREGD